MNTENTTMTQAHTELRALAEAAEKDGQHICTNPRDSNAWKANEAWHKAASPEVVIALLNQIAQLEQAKCLHQIAEPAASVEKQIEEVMGLADAFVEATQANGAWFYNDKTNTARNAIDEKLRTLLCSSQSVEQAAPQAVQAAVPDGWRDQLEQALCDLQTSPYPATAVAVKRIEKLLAAAPANPAEGVPAQAAELDIDDLIDRLLDAQQDLNLAANVHMDQSIASASTLLDEVEIALRTLAATHPTQQGLDAQDASILQYLLSNAKYHEWDGGYRADFDISINADVNGVRAESAKEAVQNILAAQAKQGGAYHG